MRQRIIAANWKMHGSSAMATTVLTTLAAQLAQNAIARIVILPPSLYIDLTGRLLRDTPLCWGGQNISEHEAGAYTGDISAAMLADLHCRYALVGHSERRQLHGETDAVIAKKFLAAKQHKLIPILCIGETQDEFAAGKTQHVLWRQLDAVLDAPDGGIAAFSDAVIAYEPVWAIGTGAAATPAQAQLVHAMVRNKLMRLNQGIGQAIPIIYGGSIKPSNAAALFAMPDIDGGLVGGASLQPNDFIEIVKCIK